MTPESFTKYWKESYSKCPPIGYYLREVYSDIWFRIHTLPFSKRYAETKDEEKEIIRRHKLILSDLAGETDKYVLITTEGSSSPVPAKKHSKLRFVGKDRQYFYSIPMHEIDRTDEPYYWHFFMTEDVSWKDKSVDALLKQVAEDEVVDVLFVGVNQNCVYHPYDGGADIFMKDDSKRNLLKDKYSSWFSQHPSGL